MTLESHTQNMHIWEGALSGNIHLIETIISQTITTAVTVTPDGGSHPHVTREGHVWLDDIARLNSTVNCIGCSVLGSSALCDGPTLTDTPLVRLTTPLATAWAAPEPNIGAAAWAASITRLSLTRARLGLSSLPNLKTEYKMKMYRLWRHQCLGWVKLFLEPWWPNLRTHI